MRRFAAIIVMLGASAALAEQPGAEATALAQQVVSMLDTRPDMSGDPGQVAMLRLSAAGELQAECLKKNGRAPQQCMRAMVNIEFEQMTAKLQPEIERSARAAAVQGYAETFSVEELKSLAAFFATPLGSKLVRSTPVMAAKTQDVRRKILLDAIEKWADAAGKAATVTGAQQ